jgi:acyl carrier protein
MTRDSVIARLIPIMEDVFDEDNLVYADEMTAESVAEWDSLSHIRFMVSIERAFGFRFSTGEIEQYRNLGELVSAICAKAQG